jgi:hypothetical protein
MISSPALIVVFSNSGLLYLESRITQPESKREERLPGEIHVIITPCPSVYGYNTEVIALQKPET